jgi:hypothetical protein
MKLKRKISKRTLLPIVGLVLFLMLLARNCLFRPGTHRAGSAFNQGHNALWVGVEWVDTPHSPEEITALVAELQRHQIHTLYVYAGYRKADGTFTQSCLYAADFISATRELTPGLDIQAWIGLPLQTTDLHDPTVRTQIVQFARERLDQDGFNGIHLDPEPIADGNPDLLTLLDELRPALGPQTTLSLSGRRINPFAAEIQWPLVGRWAWSAPYYREIAARTDQIAVMIYDSALPWDWLYRYWSRFQVIALSRALDPDSAELFIGIPTSEEATRTHHPEAENIDSGLSGIIDGLNDAEALPEKVTGVAVYPAWETDAREWETYRRLWILP